MQAHTSVDSAGSESGNDATARKPADTKGTTDFAGLNH